MNNERGGIISKLFMIPVGVALMVGFFFLGYYVGKYQSRSGAESRSLPPLPEIGGRQLPKQDELTFYKTLTEKGNKTVSLDLKPTSKKTSEPSSGARDDQTDASRAVSPPSKTPKQIEINLGKSGARIVKATEPQNAPAQPKKEGASPPAPNDKVRYSIQIGSYPEKEMAEEEIKRMKKRGYAAFLVSSEVADKGTWYRVRLGSFSKKAAAEKLIGELRTKEGLSPFITTE